MPKADNNKNKYIDYSIDQILIDYYSINQILID